MKEKEDVCVCVWLEQKYEKGKNKAAHKVRICSSIVNVTDREIGTRIIDLFLDTQFFFAMELNTYKNYFTYVHSVCAPVEQNIRKKDYKREVEKVFFLKNFIHLGVDFPFCTPLFSLFSAFIHSFNP